MVKAKKRKMCTFSPSRMQTQAKKQLSRFPPQANIRVR